MAVRTKKPSLGPMRPQRGGPMRDRRQRRPKDARRERQARERAGEE